MSFVQGHLAVFRTGTRAALSGLFLLFVLPTFRFMLVAAFLRRSLRAQQVNAPALAFPPRGLDREESYRLSNSKTGDEEWAMGEGQALYTLMAHMAGSVRRAAGSYDKAGVPPLSREDKDRANENAGAVKKLWLAAWA